MGDRIIELLYRNLQKGAARRRAAIEDFYTKDCALYVLPGIFVGHDALDKFAGDLRATHPHFAIRRPRDQRLLRKRPWCRFGSTTAKRAAERCRRQTLKRE